MKVKIYTKGMQLLCVANIQSSHLVLLSTRGKLWEFEGNQGMYWEDFSAYVEEAFA